VQKRVFSLILLAATTVSAALIRDVREAIDHNDFARAESHIQAYRTQNGVTSEMLEALSWIARGALNARKYDLAEKYAQLTYDLSVKELRKDPLDRDRYLPIALGAAIEVQGQAMAARGERSSAIEYLQRELKAYGTTSIRTRIQKNINLLSLEGKPAPAIHSTEYLGPRTPALSSLKGKPALLFFWAHWCGDCKADVPTLARVVAEYGNRISLIGPTQRYGYVAGGEEAPPDVELKYIDDVRRKYYSPVSEMSVPVSAEAFKRYGASTTPTVVLVDRAGIVRLYHPGAMTYDQLKPYLDRVAGAAQQSEKSSKSRTGD
jgi:thiol-disulfide isomerase/thioredoxin